ncbi:MAG: uroporphyrinogen decarboxylase [Deltaproteobacteria bacterium]
MRDRFLRACAGEAVRPVPVWLMRQAGRYLPAYQAVRGRADFLTLCKTPELAAEVTIQPVDILGVDAAILFSDILIPLEPMGIGLAFSEGKGPLLSPIVRSEEAVAALRPISPEEDLPFVLETIRILRRELEGKVPLIGFAGAPFTLATYLVEGGSSKAFVHTKRMMYEAPALFRRLMDHLTEATILYLSAQIDAGVQAVQLFDTWAGVLTRQDYEAFVLPSMHMILEALSDRGVPRISFVFNGGHLLGLVKAARPDVIGLDWRTDITEAVTRLGPDVVLQGNLDPCALFLPEKALRERVESILCQGRSAKAHIFNLGHGILPECPPEKAKLLVDLVHEVSLA